MSSRTAVLTVVGALLGFSLVGDQPLHQGSSECCEYKPRVGQAGKDVVWVPTPDLLVEPMLRMAGVGSSDYVIDLGSGDGRIVITAAAKFGARGLGIEYNPDMVALSIRNAERAGVAERVKFVEADIFESDFNQATVITVFLLQALNLKLSPRFLDLRPGTRVVSYAFTMEEWQPDQMINVYGENAYLWIVPARVAGTWKATVATGSDEEVWTLTVDQEYQILTGQVHLGDESFDLVDARLRGTKISFHFVDASGAKIEFSGRAFSDRMEGIVRNQGTSLKWSAMRENVRAEVPRT